MAIWVHAHQPRKPLGRDARRRTVIQERTDRKSAGSGSCEVLALRRRHRLLAVARGHQAMHRRASADSSSTSRDEQSAYPVKRPRLPSRVRSSPTALYHTVFLSMSLGPRQLGISSGDTLGNSWDIQKNARQHGQKLACLSSCQICVSATGAVLTNLLQLPCSPRVRISRVRQLFFLTNSAPYAYRPDLFRHAHSIQLVPTHALQVWVCRRV